MHPRGGANGERWLPRLTSIETTLDQSGVRFNNDYNAFAEARNMFAAACQPDADLLENFEEIRRDLEKVEHTLDLRVNEFVRCFAMEPRLRPPLLPSLLQRTHPDRCRAIACSLSPATELLTRWERGDGYRRHQTTTTTTAANGQQPEPIPSEPCIREPRCATARRFPMTTFSR